MTTHPTDAFFYWSGVMFWAVGIFAFVAGSVLIYIEEEKL